MYVSSLWYTNSMTGKEGCYACIEMNPEKVRDVYKEGVCKTHYKDYSNNKPFHKLRSMNGTKKKCYYINTDGTPCGRDASAKGLCQTHREQQRHNEPLRDINVKTPKPEKCTYVDTQGNPCPYECESGGLCKSHNRHKREGKEPHDLRPIVKNRTHICAECGIEFKPKDTQSKFCSRACRGLSQKSPLAKAIAAGNKTEIISLVRERSVLGETGCWEWKGSFNGTQYPILSGLGRNRSYLLHRVVLETKIGRPLGKEQAHHVCANRKCVNPDHLQPISQASNLGEMLQRNFFISRIAELEEEVHAASDRIQHLEYLLDLQGVSVVDSFTPDGTNNTEKEREVV